MPKKTPRRLLATFSILLALSNQALGQENRLCITEADAKLTGIEEAKNHLLNGNYTDFFQIENEYVPPEKDQREEMIDILSSNFPGGFSSCTTVLWEPASEYLGAQMVVYTDFNDKPFFLFWTTLMINGSWTVQTYVLTNNFEEVNAAWR